MKKSIYFLICVSLIIVSCVPKNQQEDKLIGKWSMHKIYDGETDVTSEHNPKNNRWIEFKEDGSFESDGDPYGQNTGNWNIDAGKSILFINSDSDDDDSEWNISFKGDQTIWTGIGTPRKEGFKLIHRKESN